MAQCYLRDEAYAEAAATLSELLEVAPEGDAVRTSALFLSGEALAALGRWQEAERAYAAYLPLAPEVEYLTWQRIGAARRAGGDLAGASAAYRSALARSPDWTNTVSIRRTLAALALDQGKVEEAVAQYDALRAGQTQGAWAAEMHYLAGQALAQQAAAEALVAATATPVPGGAPTPAPGTAAPGTAAPGPAQTTLGAAQARWQAAVDADVTSRYAHAAIVALLDSGATVDEYQRGRANYHKGAYQLAVAAFDRLRQESAAGGRPAPGDAWYYAGLSYLAMGDAAAGLAQLERFIADYPEDALWADAWLAQARAQAQTSPSAAIATYRRLADLRPETPQAAKALWQAALLQEGIAADAAAIDAYLAVGRRYPNLDEAWRAYQAAAMIAFRNGDHRAAAATWREMAEQEALPAVTRQMAYFWLGRSLAAAGATADALVAWRAAIDAGPETYYGLRAAEWRQRYAGATPTPAVRAPAGELVDERAEIAAWLQSWAGEGKLDLPPAVTADPDWQRGKTLLSLGLRSQALANWDRVQKRYRGAPWTMMALALAYRDAGAHRLSLLSAEMVVNRWGGAMSNAPPAVQRLAYPFPYADLIRSEAAKYDLDPRLVLSVMRQESRFESGAASSAGAQGLMQVMPGTAASIAAQLNWPGFQPHQIYWPYVNVAFGTYYIAQWLDHFHGSVATALAAYNGGPGNASKWYDAATGDDDLLVATINLSETRIYVQAVWANLEAYKRLYP